MLPPDKELRRIGKIVGFSNSFLDEILSVSINFDEVKIIYYVQGLTSIDSEKVMNELKKEVSGENKGLILSKFILYALERTRKLYIKKKIKVAYFGPTMESIPSFCYENLREYKDYESNPVFWIGLHLSLRMFRIGEFEFQLAVYDNKPEVGIHIPRGAKLTKRNILKSLKEMYKFVGTYFPTFKNCPVYCMSWLMSPQLKNLLPKQSKILTFQSFFDQVSTYKDESYLQWVFGCSSLDKEFKSETRLQKKLKEFLSKGEVFEGALGRIKKEFHWID